MAEGGNGQIRKELKAVQSTAADGAGKVGVLIPEKPDPLTVNSSGTNHLKASHGNLHYVYIYSGVLLA